MTALALPQLWVPPKPKLEIPSFNFIRHLMPGRTSANRLLGMQGSAGPPTGFAIVQAAVATPVASNSTSVTATFASTPTLGNKVLLHYFTTNNNGGGTFAGYAATPSGMTLVGQVYAANSSPTTFVQFQAFQKTVAAGDTASWAVAGPTDGRSTDMMGILALELSFDAGKTLAFQFASSTQNNEANAADPSTYPLSVVPTHVPAIAFAGSTQFNEITAPNSGNGYSGPKTTTSSFGTPATPAPSTWAGLVATSVNNAGSGASALWYNDTTAGNSLNGAAAYSVNTLFGGFCWTQAALLTAGTFTYTGEGISFVNAANSQAVNYLIVVSEH